MKGFRNLLVWQKSHQLALSLYNLSKKFPEEEKYGLTSQLRRAMLSIPTNITEGAGRKSEKENIHFLSIAMGSANEVDYLIKFSRDFDIITVDESSALSNHIEEIKSMLFVLIKNKSSSINLKP